VYFAKPATLVTTSQETNSLFPTNRGFVPVRLAVGSRENTWGALDGFHSDKNGIYRTGFMAATTGYDPSTSLDNYMTGRIYKTATGTSGPQLILSKPGNTPVWNVFNGSTWNDRAGTAGSVFFPEGIQQWGNITLVADGVAVRSRDATGTSNFATVAGSPAVNALFISPLNIVVGAYLDATEIAGSDAWYASDANDYTNWATGQAASGNLRQTPGVLRAGAVFGNDVLLFKDRGIMRGQYVGLANAKWKWDLIPGSESYGAWGPGCVVAADGKIYFLGDSGLCAFDGVNVERLDTGIGATLGTTIYYPGGALNGQHRYTRLVYDSITRKIFIFNFGQFVFSGSTYTNSQTQAKHFTLHIDSKQWGYQSRVKDETDGSDAYCGVILGGAAANTFSTSGEWTFNTNIWLISKTNDYAVALTTEFSSSNCGTNYKPSLQTYRLGQLHGMTTVTGFIPRWQISDGAGTDLSGATVKEFEVRRRTALMIGGSIDVTGTLTAPLYKADFTSQARLQHVILRVNCEACIDGGTWVNPVFVPGAN
jgi:hypothetical protein